jgi:hypothetical protein
MQHIIKKQIIQLRLNSRQDAFRIQNRMSEHYRHDLLPVMETLFDEAAGTDETLYIDSLEIDLGVLTEKDIGRPKWDDEILALLTNQLREKLKQHSIGVKKTSEQQPASIGIGRQWLFYMKRGYLPWNLLETGKGWKQKVLEALSTDYESVTALRNLIRSDADALTRIVEQHNEAFLVQLIETVTAQKQQHLSELLDELEILYRSLVKIQTLKYVGSKGEIRNMFWRTILEVSAPPDTTGVESVYVKLILERLFGRPIRSRDLSKEVTSKLTNLMPIIGLLEEKSPNIGKDISSEIDEEINLRQNGKTKEDEEKAELGEGIFVLQAGAVLLHPFLGTFFDRLKLTKAGAFIDLAAQQKALYLVHYLCIGAVEAEEHELVIPKVLCGYPLKKPVIKGVRLTEKEKDEADHLLEELIRQWEKLKNTTPAGLREAFLQRNGKLLTKNDLWYIQVESDTIDILLDHLPWNLSMIKLPWMKDIIRVEWR